MPLKLSNKVQDRLQQELVIWLTTVTAEGQPQSSLVWFLWDGHSFLIFSEPQQGKIKALQANPRVALNLNSDPQGGSVATFEANAEILGDGHSATSLPAYIEKYRDGIKRIGLTPDTFASKYSIALRVTPERLRAW